MTTLVLWAATNRQNIRHGYWMTKPLLGLHKTRLCDASNGAADPLWWTMYFPQPHDKCERCMFVLEVLLWEAIDRCDSERHRVRDMP